MALRLRPYRLSDEAAALALNEAMLDDHFRFLLWWDETMSWPEYLAMLDRHRRGLDLGERQVRNAQLAAVVDGELVGRVSIRYELNEFLSRVGGHVGYGVAPSHRRKGYASEILAQALIILRAEGVDRVLVTCDDSNVASAKTIEQNGGVLDSILPPEDGEEAVRRYWIE
jgi:predicted acetyltransferase